MNRRAVLIAVSLTAALFAAASAVAGDDRRHGYYGGDRYSYSLGLGFAYPPPYWRGYGPGYPYYYPGYYYPAYGPRYGYWPPYGGSIGFGYRSGYHDAYSLFFSLPLYLGPRYEPAPPPATVLVPSLKSTTQATPSDCLQQREYQTEILIDDKAVPAYGTACLQADGSWKIVSGPFAAQ